MSSWYGDVKDSIGFDVKEDVIVQNSKPESQVLSGPQESSSFGSAEKPWSGRLCAQVTPPNTGHVSQKEKKKVGDSPLCLIYHHIFFM